MNQKPNFDDYTVAWICQQEDVRKGAVMMLDAEHGSIPSASDLNQSFIFGSISCYNIIITGLPELDNEPEIPSASFVTEMLRIFPNIEFGMLICTGGGVPGRTDASVMKIGDLVVGLPQGEHSGALIYDAEKGQAGHFECTGFLPRPPEAVLVAADLVIDDYNIGRTNILHEDIRYAKARARDEDINSYVSAHQHSPIHDDNNEPQITIHRGTVALGQFDVQNDEIRDRLAKNYEVLAFQTGAARALQDLPCIVIQGITHYCGSQTLERDFEDPVMAAVAYGRQVIVHIIDDELESEFTSSSYETDWGPEEENNVITLDPGPIPWEKLIQWLAPVDYGRHQTHYIKARHPRTGRWLLKSSEYQSWMRAPGQVLFCPAAQGAGKTILSSIVIKNLKSRFRANPKAGVAYFYFDSQSPQEQTPENLLLSLVNQLVQQRPSMFRTIEESFRKVNFELRPDWIDILRCVRSTIQGFRRVFVVVDALDECIEGCRRAFLRELFKLQKHYEINVLATSRPSPEIIVQFKDAIQLGICADAGDVSIYVADNMARLPSFVQTYDDLIPKVVKQAHGRFLLAKLYVDSLTHATSSEGIAHLLGHPHSESEAYDLLYDMLMNRVLGQSQERVQLAKKVLSWLTFATRPLSIQELKHAISQINLVNQPSTTDIISACCGLVTLDLERGLICLAHRTARDYLIGARDRYLRGSEAEVGMTCIRYLSSKNFERGSCGSDGNFQRRLDTSPLYAYAAENWGHHCCEIYPLPHEIDSFVNCTPKVMAAWQAVMTASSRTNHENYSQKFPRKTSALHLAACVGAKNVIRSFVDNKTSCNEKDSLGRIPLLWAAERGHGPIVELLLQNNRADTNSRNHLGQTSLSLAAKNGHTRVVELLLTYSANPNLKDLRGGSPLCYAVEGRHAEITKLLLSRGVVDLRPKYLAPEASTGRSLMEYQTPLSMAAQHGDVDVIRLLLAQEGINPHEGYKIQFGPPHVESLEYGFEMLYTEITALGFAMKHGYEAAVVLILENAGPDPSPGSDWSGEKLLFLAATQGSSEITRQLLSKNKINPNTRDEWGRTPLIVAAWGGHNTIVELFLATENIDPSIMDKDGNAALSVAASRGNKSAVEMLLKNTKTDPDFEDRSGRTPLSLAAERAHEAVMGLLLATEGIDPDHADLYGRTPLSWAMAPQDDWDKKKDHRRVVIQMLTTGRVDPNRQDQDRRTPLSYAVAEGRLELVETLLNFPGVDVNIRDKDGLTPLFWAAASGHGAVVELLLDTGRVDVNSRSYRGSTALSYAARNGHEAVLDTLLSTRGIDADSRDEFGVTPLAEAAKAGHAAIAEQLLKSNAVDPNSRDSYHKTPLLKAAKKGHEKVVRVLLEARGIYPDSGDGFRTPLFVAAGRGHSGVVKRLLAMDRVDPDISYFGTTPLAEAAEGGHAEVVRQLLALESVSPDRRNEAGRSPLSLAIDSKQHGNSNMNDRMEVVKLLLQKPTVDPNAVDGDGLTPLIRARKADESGEMEKLLRSRMDLHPSYPRDVGADDSAPPLGVLGSDGAAVFQPRDRLKRIDSDLRSGDGDGDSEIDETDENEEKDDGEEEEEREEAIDKDVWKVHPEDEKLCLRCEKIDLDNAFSSAPDNFNIRAIERFGKVDQTLEKKWCTFCRLITAIRPQRLDSSSTDEPDKFGGFSTTTNFISQSTPVWEPYFKSSIVDTVVLGFENRIGTAGTSGFIGRLGRNRPNNSQAITLRRPCSDTADLSLAKGWISCCEERHSKRCNPEVIDLVPHLRLIECRTRKIIPIRSPIPFVALSYVWGSPLAVVDEMDHDRVEQPQQVIEDAIRVTLALGYSYLWVDRYCITKEHETIRTEQLQNMNLVYRSAEVTVIAAAGQDPSFGLPGVGPRARIPRHCAHIGDKILTVVPPDPKLVVERSFWATRGWTFQEGLLSRRRLIFTEHEMSFECGQLLCREAIKLPPQLQRKYHKFRYIQGGSWLFRNRRENGEGWNSERLTGIISQYTSKSLTYRYDILNAMLGIFQVFAAQKRPIYHLCGVPALTGHYRRDPPSLLERFITGLTWELDRPGSRRQGFPSWSWTGWEVPVKWFFHESLSIKFGLGVDVSILFEGGSKMRWDEYETLCKAGKTTQFGQHHVLEITSSVVMVSLSRERYSERFLNSAVSLLETSSFSSVKLHCSVCVGDEVMEGIFYPTKDEFSDSDFGCRISRKEWLGIVLGENSTSWSVGDTSRRTCVLIVEEAPSKQYWERIGFAQIERSTLQGDNLEQRTIRLG